MSKDEIRFREGYAAYCAGQRIGACPYVGYYAIRSWTKGWFQALGDAC